MTRRPRFVRLLLAVPLAFGGIAVAASPAAADPAITSPVSQSVVAPDATITITGTGCPAAAPVSIEIQQTTAVVRDQLDSVDAANESGSFSYDYDLAGQWDPGVQIRVSFSCTAVYDYDAGPALFSGYRYFWIELEDSFLVIDPLPTRTYGSTQQVSATTPPGVDGIAKLTIDGGVPVSPAPGGPIGRWVFTLSPDLTVGSHQLQVTFDPFGPGSTAKDTATLTITKVTPTVQLQAKKRVRAGKKLRVAVHVALEGIASRAGKIVLWDGQRKVARIQTSATGMAKARITLKGTRKHRLRAVFKGNSQTTPATSNHLKVRVRR